MISKGKRRNLLNLYRPEGEFFTENGKLCLKIGKYILRGLVPLPVDNENEIKIFPLPTFNMPMRDCGEDVSFNMPMINAQPDPSRIYRPDMATTYGAGEGALAALANHIHLPKGI